MTPTESRLLVVDDNEDNRYTLLQRLKRHGYTNVSTAVNGREALEQLRDQAFDLVLLDVIMPELTGYEVLERLKSDERLRHIPVIMISALAQLESVVRCIELGAEDYLAKPFNPILLRARVSASLEKKRLRDETAAHLARVQSELDSARDIQLGLVPDTFPVPTPEAPVEIFATLQPARQVGGDLYDFFFLDPHTLCLVVADVSDKGAPAALFMAHTSSMIRIVATLLRTPAGGRPTPAEVMASVNEELCRGNRAGMFVTVFFAMLDLSSGALSFCNAGHNAPYVIDRERHVVALNGVRSKPLGIRRSFTYATSTTTLAAGDCLFVFTDGITEAVDGTGDFFEDHRLQEILRATAGRDAEQVVGAVIGGVRAFAGATPQSDDIAAMAVRILPGVPAGGRPPSTPPAEIVITNRLDELPRVSQLLDGIAAAHCVPGDVLADLQVALDEVLANTISHAYADAGSHQIRIQFRIVDDVIEMQIEDDGVPFDPLTAPVPDTNAPLGKRPLGKLGIHLVRNLMSEIVYAREGDRNRLVLRKNLPAHEETRDGSP
jgi:sigma-B regulation protein RsbU (phosphoserine phosphatase)